MVATYDVSRSIALLPKLRIPMKIFLSWSGTRSHQVAEALRRWLVLVFPTVDAWMSSHDLKAGDRWTQELASQLANTEFGILCITQESLTSSWLMYEAGALSKSIASGRIVPYLIDLEFSEITGPIAFFQAVKYDKPGTRSLVQAVSAILPENKRTDESIDQIFEATWPLLESWFQGAGRGPATYQSKTLPLVTFKKSNGLNIAVEGAELLLSDREYPIYLFLAERSSRGAASFSNYKSAASEFRSWLASNLSHITHAYRPDFYNHTVMSSAISSIRKKMDRAGLAHMSSDLLPQKGRVGIQVNLESDILPTRDAEVVA